MSPVDADSGTWSARSLEAVHGEGPKLLSLNVMATAQNHSKSGVYSRLNRLRFLDATLTDEISDEGKRIHESILNLMGDQPSAMLAGIHALTSTARDAASLKTVVRDLFSNGLVPRLPNSSVHLIEISETLPNRYQLIRALLPTSEIYPPLEKNRGMLYAAKGLFNDTTVGLGSYIDLLMTSLAPHPWGLAVGRPGCVVLYLFGGTISGHGGVAADPILLYSSGKGTWPASSEAEGIPPTAFTNAATWWVKQLELLFSTATEPGNYVHSGLYDPQFALEKILSLEQFFRGCQSISVGSFDQHSSRLILFSVLETLGGLSTKLKWNYLTSVSRAKGILDDLKSAIPESAHAVLLPRAEAAVEALAQLQDGFLLPEGGSAEGLSLPRDKGGDEIVPLDQAVSLWLRVVRNSHHGFDKKSTPRERTLLASHNADFPAHLPDLAWLYLLHLLANPEILLRHPH